MQLQAVSALLNGGTDGCERSEARQYQPCIQLWWALAAGEFRRMRETSLTAGSWYLGVCVCVVWKLQALRLAYFLRCISRTSPLTKTPTLAGSLDAVNWRLTDRSLYARDEPRQHQTTLPGSAAGLPEVSCCSHPRPHPLLCCSAPPPPGSLAVSTAAQTALRPRHTEFGGLIERSTLHSR